MRWVRRSLRAGDESGERAHRHPLGEHPSPKVADVSAELLDGRQVVGPVYGFRQVSDPGALQAEQVAFRDDAGQPGAVDQHDVAHSVADHGERRTIGRRVQRERHGARGHDTRNGRIERARLQHHAVHHVAQGKDAERHAVCVDHDHRADAELPHPAQRLRHFLVGSAGDRRAPQQLRERRINRFSTEVAHSTCARRRREPV